MCGFLCWKRNQETYQKQKWKAWYFCMQYFLTGLVVWNCDSAFNDTSVQIQFLRYPSKFLWQTTWGYSTATAFLLEVLEHTLNSYSHLAVATYVLCYMRHISGRRNLNVLCGYQCNDMAQLFRYIHHLENLWKSFICILRSGAQSYLQVLSLK